MGRGLGRGDWQEEIGKESVSGEAMRRERALERSGARFVVGACRSACLLARSPCTTTPVLKRPGSPARARRARGVDGREGGKRPRVPAYPSTRAAPPRRPASWGEGWVRCGAFRRRVWAVASRPQFRAVPTAGTLVKEHRRLDDQHNDPSSCQSTLPQGERVSQARAAVAVDGPPFTASGALACFSVRGPLVCSTSSRLCWPDRGSRPLLSPPFGPFCPAAQPLPRG